MIHAVDPEMIPDEAWEGIGADERIDQDALSENMVILSYRVGPKRNLISGPGPNKQNVDGFLPLGLAISFFTRWAGTGAGQPGTLV